MIVSRSGGTITLLPQKLSQASALIVLCHGLGDTSEGLLEAAQFLSQSLPHCTFCLPTAPTQPVTMNMGMSMPSWYDIVGLDERSNEQCQGLEASVSTVKDILERHHQQYQLPYSRMLLMGFSQGGALSLFTGLSLQQPLAGLCVLSGYLPATKKLQLQQTKVPIFHGHGTNDPVVNYQMAVKTQSVLQQQHNVESYQLKSYPIAHTLSMDELQDVQQFLLQQLPDHPQYCCSSDVATQWSIKQLKTMCQVYGMDTRTFTEKSELVAAVQSQLF